MKPLEQQKDDSTEPPVDHATMARHLEDPALVEEILVLFREDAATTLTELKQSLAANEYDVVARLAHRFKGALQAIVAAPAARAAWSLQRAAQNRNSHDMASLLERLEAHVALVSASIADRLNAMSQMK